MTSDVIIDECLKGIGEVDIGSPVELSRADCLTHINHAYREIIGPRLNKQISAVLTVTSGIASLPADFLDIVQVYDGDVKLAQIFDIDDKVDDAAKTSQYWIPNETQVYFYGKTPTSIIAMYYIARPAVLTDSSGSTPSDLKARYHMAFRVYIKMVIAFNRSDLNDYYTAQAEWLDILDDITAQHGYGRAGIDAEMINNESGW